MRTCLIYGQNGLDLDVTLNLEALYKKLGFSVFFSTRLYDSDLLVVTRAVDEPADISHFNYKQIHIFDYAGWDYFGFLRMADTKLTFVFTTDPGRKSKLVEKSGLSPANIFEAFPPVDTSLWSRELKQVKYGLVHVGNFKIIDDSDKVRHRFNEIIRDCKVHVWGSGWTGHSNYHGKAPLFWVSSVYSVSEYALGLMYPWQRESTYSGRFWHAPLNGCTLLSEDAFYADKIPGVIATDYSAEDILARLHIKPDREKVRQMAARFWNEQFEKTSGYVRVCLDMVDWKSTPHSGKLIYYYVRFYNLLLRIYQKSGISALLSRK